MSTETGKVEPRVKKLAARIWVISELYAPEDDATGYYLTGIAEGLAKRADLSVICVQPTYSKRGRLAPKTETLKGVKVRRCWSTRFDKNNLALRLVNIFTVTTSIFWNALFGLRHGDQVLVVTNPPLLPFAILIAAKIKRCKIHLLVHDVYPEALVVTGFTKENSFIYNIGSAVNRWLYGSVDQIIVLGRDMAELARKKARSRPVQIIENWADISEIYPCTDSENTYRSKLGLANKKVVLYSGNLGRTHCIDTIIESASLLRDRGDVHFLIVGEGAQKSAMQKASNDLDLKNVTFLPRQPRERLRDLQNAGDIAIISFLPGMKGVSVPSRMYNMMAAGKPIIAVTSKDHELAQTILENNAGWVIEARNSEGLARLIAETTDSEIAERGANARKAVVENYSYKAIMAKYYSIFGLAESE